MPLYYGIYGANNEVIDLQQARVDAALFINRLNGTKYDYDLTTWTTEEQRFIDLMDSALFKGAIDNATFDALINEYSQRDEENLKRLADFFKYLKRMRGAVSVFGYRGY